MAGRHREGVQRPLGPVLGETIKEDTILDFFKFCLYVALKLLSRFVTCMNAPWFR